MRVMSFNILCAGKGENEWQLRIPRVVATIKAANPDTFGVQEAHKGWIDALMENFGEEYDYVGVGRDDGKEAGEYSAVFYKKDLFKVIDSETFWLSETPDIPTKSWDATCFRICTLAVLERTDGKRFVHMNLHAEYKGVLARKNSAKIIIEKAKKFSIPVVCTGDYNESQGSALYDIMTSDKLADAKYLAKETMTGTTYHEFGNPELEDKLPIDHIFVSEKNVKVQKYKIITDKIDGHYPSDHYPVYVDIEI